MVASPTSSLNILEYTGSNRIGGVETYLLRLAPYLEGCGHRVVWATRGKGLFVDALRQRATTVYPVHRGGKLAFLTLLRVVGVIRREKIDLVHTHIFSANSVGALAAKICGIPSVARVPANESVDHYQRSTYIYAVSKNVARHCVDLGIPPQRLRVFYNGVDIPCFSQLLSRSEAHRFLKLPAELFFVACIASLTARKGQRFLVEALAQLPPHVHLLLAGEGTEEAALRAQVEALQLGKRVHFLGFCSDVRNVLAASDAFVLPSLLEGLPNSVLEAQTARVPVIATSIAGTPEIVREGETGLLVPPGEVAPLVGALNRMQDSALRAHLATQARAMVEREFDGQECLERVEAFFRAVVGAWRAGHRMLPPDTSWQENSP